MEDKEFQEFLKTKTCRGCFNHCPLNNPNCNRSKIFIKDALEEFNNKKKKDNQIMF